MNIGSTAISNPRQTIKSVSTTPSSPSLIEALRLHASQKSKDFALGFVGSDEPYGDLSWSDLYKKSCQFAAFVRESGATPGDRIVILTPFVSHQILAFLGSIAAGCIPTIVSYPSSKQSADAFMSMLTPVLENCHPRLLLSEDGFSEYLKGSEFAQMFRGFPSKGRLPLPMDAHETVGTGPLFLQFSSGTTGARKAVAVSSQMFVSQSDAYAAALGLSEHDKAVNWLPLYHDMGLVAAFLILVHRGISSVHQSPFDWLTRQECLFELVERHGATVLWLPNFAYELLASRVDRAHVGDIRSIRAIINCSEPVREETHARFFAAFGSCGLQKEALQTCYAMAETTFAVTQSSPGAAPLTDRISQNSLYRSGQAVPVDPNHDNADILLALSSGRPVPGTNVRIAGTNEDRRLGEIEVYSASLFEGYLYHPLPRKDFCPDGWFKTGDIGYLADGELFVTGRQKDVIIRRGHNLFSADIESVLSEVEGTKPGRLVVFGVDDKLSGTQRLVIMAERAGDPKDDRQVASAIRERLLERMNETVDEIVLCETNTLQKSTSGKLSRDANRKKFLIEHATKNSNLQSSKSAEGSVDSIEGTLEGIWRSVLKVPLVGPNTRLFAELGLDSIGAMQGIGDIRKRFGRKIDPTQILTLDTIEKQAQVIRSDKGISGTDGVVICLQKGDDLNPLFLIHPAAGRGWPYSNLLPYIPKTKTVYALQSPELFENGALLTVEEMATRYLDAIANLNPHGPLSIAGWSFGGAVAHTIACLAQRRDRNIAQLILFDTDPPRSKAGKLLFRLRQQIGRKVAINTSSAIIDRIAGTRPSICSRYLQTLDPNRTDVEHYTKLERYSTGRRKELATKRPATRTNMYEIAERIFKQIEASCPADDFRPFLIPAHDTEQRLLNARVLVKNRALSVLFNPTGHFVGDIHVISAENPDRLKGWQKYVKGQVVVKAFLIHGTPKLTPHLNMMAAVNAKTFGAYFCSLIA